MLPQFIQPLHELAHPGLHLRGLLLQSLPRLTGLTSRLLRALAMRKGLAFSRTVDLVVHVTRVTGIRVGGVVASRLLVLLGVGVVTVAENLLLLAWLLLLAGLVGRGAGGVGGGCGGSGWLLAGRVAGCAGETRRGECAWAEGGG